MSERWTVAADLREAARVRAASGNPGIATLLQGFAERVEKVEARCVAADAELSELRKVTEGLERALHEIAEFTMEHGDWYEQRTAGKVAGRVHRMARSVLAGEREGNDKR